MKIIIQRVKLASVTVDGAIVGAIGQGVLVFLGVAKTDTHQHVDALVNKLVELRIFDDRQGKMNLAAKEVGAAFLVVSQFTLYGDCQKGRRPSFDQAADPKTAETLYNDFIAQLKQQQVPVQTGKFRAMMDVSLVNDGPVTFILEQP